MKIRTEQFHIWSLETPAILHCIQQLLDCHTGFQDSLSGGKDLVDQWYLDPWGWGICCSKHPCYHQLFNTQVHSVISSSWNTTGSAPHSFLSGGSSWTHDFMQSLAAPICVWWQCLSGLAAAGLDHDSNYQHYHQCWCSSTSLFYYMTVPGHQEKGQ
jgi:hypothetical protein